MVQTYFDETCVFNRDYIKAPNRIRHIKKKFLITTDHGGWVVLNRTELDTLNSHKISNALFTKLEQKGIIFTNHNRNILEHYQRQRYGFLNSGVRLHILVPTLRCNHRCVYCHSSADSSSDIEKDMDKETASKTIDFIFQTPARNITIEFQGGDALINFDLFKHLVLRAKKVNKIFRKNVHFALVTNLTIMKDEFLRWIKKENISIASSLDGPAFLHNLNRRYENGKTTYEDVVKWIQKVRKVIGNPPGLMMVTTRHSLKHWKEIIDEYVKWDQKEIQLKYLSKLGFASSTWKNIGYTIEEFIEFWTKSMDYIIELNKKGTFIRERFVHLILKKILTDRDPGFLDFRSPCGIVIGQLAYNYNGDIYSCDEGRNFEFFKLGNVSKDMYKDVVTSEQGLELVNASILDNYLCDNCVYKPYCGVCPVLNYAEDGNIIPKLAINSRCKLFKAMFDYVFEKIIFDESVRKIFFNWVKI
jgi:His-Xaa-Ser system radical SAM maturase HxsB